MRHFSERLALSSVRFPTVLLSFFSRRWSQGAGSKLFGVVAFSGVWQVHLEIVIPSCNSLVARPPIWGGS